MMKRIPFCLISSLLFMAATVVPFARAQDLQGVVNINFITDIRLFTVMSAINAGGFDYETAPAMHPVRRQVRQKLKELDPKLLQRLHDFYIAHHTADTPQREVARYTSLALLLTDPPRFEITLASKDIPPEVNEVLGFEQILPLLYEQAGLDRLWLEVRPQYLAEIDQYRPVARQAILQALRYLRTEARIVMDRQILLIPDLMTAHGMTNSRIMGNLYYLVVGPAESPVKNLTNIRHEYLHFLLDPLIEKHGAIIVEQQQVLQLLNDRPALLEKYRRDLKLLNTESLIEAIQLRIDRPNDVRERLAYQYESGNVLVYNFYEKLQEFEKASPLSFPEYFPAVVQAFVLKRELQRKDWFVTESAELRRERENRQKRLQEQSQWVRDLDRSNQLLQKKSFDEAEKLLLDMKQRRPEDPSVLFGLGQIELQKKNAEAAESYLKAVMDHPQAVAWMAAWSRVYLSTVFLATDRFAEARALLQLVVNSPGDDLRGARAEAKKRLATLATPPT